MLASDYQLISILVPTPGQEAISSARIVIEYLIFMVELKFWKRTLKHINLIQFIS